MEMMGPSGPMKRPGGSCWEVVCREGWEPEEEVECKLGATEGRTGWEGVEEEAEVSAAVPAVPDCCCSCCWCTAMACSTFPGVTVVEPSAQPVTMPSEALEPL